MTKKKKLQIGIGIGCVVIIGIVVLVLSTCTPPPPPPPPPPGFSAVTVNEDLGNRLLDRRVDAIITVSGEGESANWGIGRRAKFLYTATAQSTSKIIERKIIGKEIKVVEERHFENPVQNLVVSDVSIKLNFDTLPVKDVFDFVDAVCTGLSIVKPSAALVLKPGMDIAKATLKKINGVSLSELVKKCLPNGVSKQVDAALNEMFSNKIKAQIGKIESVGGKTYRLTYTQKEDGQIMKVSWTYADGSEVTDEEENLVLRRLNVFMDCHAIPKRDCKPGATWSINARDISEVFDPFVEGDYYGEATVKRLDDAADGVWNLRIQTPVKVYASGKNGTTTADMTIKNGTATVHPKYISVNRLDVNGIIHSATRTRHHLLFTATLSGSCEFTGTMVSEVIGEGKGK